MGDIAAKFRFAKEGNDWSTVDLWAYNVSVSLVTDPSKFFPNGIDPSLDHLDPTIFNALSSLKGPNNLSDAFQEYLEYLALATSPAEESTLVMFASETLRLLGFNERNIVVVPRYNIPFTNCRDVNRDAQPDVCLLHRPTGLILLVLIQDKSIIGEIQTVPEAQVTAAAIAAFEFNNKKRARRGRVSLDAISPVSA